MAWGRGAAKSHLETYGGPLRFASNNAPSKQMILGTVRLPILAGNKRYAHITSLRSDKVLPELFGIEGLASEDSVRRAFTHASNEELTLCSTVV